VCAFFAAALGTCSTCAHAGHPTLSLSIGRSVTSHLDWTNAAFLDLTTSTYTFQDVHWQPAFAVGFVQHRDTTRDDLDHNVFIGAAGARLVNWWRNAFFSFQFAAAAGRTDALSSAPQFVSSLGWQGRHWQLMLRHISNGNVFHGPNIGETMLLAGVRF
jgi:hypothetical protein